MSKCKTYQLPVRSTRKTVAMGLEDKYGVQPPVLSDMPIYGDLNFGPSGDNASTSSLVDNATRSFTRDSFFFFNSRTILLNNIDNFKTILQSSGFSDDGNGILSVGRGKSLSGIVQNDGTVYPFYGARSTWDLTATSGGLVSLDFAMSGIYSDRYSDTPKYKPIKQTPERFIGSKATITWANGYIIVPKLSTIALSPGLTINRQSYLSSNNRISRILLNNPIDGVCSLTIEIDRQFDYSLFVEKKMKCEIKIELNGLTVTSPVSYLKSYPSIGSANGIAMQQLDFGIGKENFIFSFA